MDSGEKAKKGCLLARLLVLFALFLLVASVEAATKPKGSTKRSPIIVTSKQMEAHSKEGWILFKGDVKATQEDMKVEADRLKIIFNSKGKMEKILAFGHVKVVRGERVVVAEKAEYRVNEDVVEFTGHPKAWEGKNLVIGERMLYYLKENRSVVIGGKGRVSAVIYPKKEKKSEAKSRKTGKKLQK